MAVCLPRPGLGWVLWSALLHGRQIEGVGFDSLVPEHPKKALAKHRLSPTACAASPALLKAPNSHAGGSCEGQCPPVILLCLHLHIKLFVERAVDRQPQVPVWDDYLVHDRNSSPKCSRVGRLSPPVRLISHYYPYISNTLDMREIPPNIKKPPFAPR
jgi:hypothetical protein